MSFTPLPPGWACGRQPPRLHLHLDFDGTLVPLSADPDHCRPDADLRCLLQELADHPAVAVAILSGRSLEDLSGRLAIQGLALAGNHGLEIACSGLRWRHPDAVALRPLLASMAALVRLRLAGLPGAHLEDKTLSLSLHYRQVPPLWRGILKQRLRDLQRDLSGWRQLRCHPGHEVLDIRPALPWTKASAARLLCRRWPQPGESAYFYAGDDSTDEDVFRAFSDGFTVKIGSRLSSSAARFRLEDPAALRHLLEAVRRRLP